MESDADMADAPTIDLSDLQPEEGEIKRPGNVSDAKHEMQLSEFADQGDAFSCLRGLNVDDWISNKHYLPPSHADFWHLHTLMKMMAGVYGDQDWRHLLTEAYKENAMSATRIGVEFDATNVRITVWGCDLFNWRKDSERVLLLPEVKINDLGPMLKDEGIYRDAIRGLAYVKEIRAIAAPRGDANKCYVGQTPLYHLYFATSMQIARVLSFISLDVLSRQKLLTRGRPLVLLISPARREQHSEKVHSREKRG